MPKLPKWTMPDGSWTFDVHGPSTWVLAPGLPAIAYVKGNVSVTGDAGGTLTFNHTGKVLDVCAARAPLVLKARPARVYTVHLAMGNALCKTLRRRVGITGA